MSWVLEIGAVVPGGAAANGVDEDEEDEKRGVEYCQMPPLLPHVPQHSHLT